MTVDSVDPSSAREFFVIVEHQQLSGSHLDALRALFDSEYLATHGDWDPGRPYGYSPADVHVLLFRDSTLLGHAGFQRRRVSVGAREVGVAGTGGVLVHPGWRGSGVGRRVMVRAQQEMLDDGEIDFGYLGCRDDVVPFYASAGWSRIHATERHVSMTDPPTMIVSPEGPILIFEAAGSPWPEGDIDLRGTPW